MKGKRRDASEEGTRGARAEVQGSGKLLPCLWPWPMLDRRGCGHLPEGHTSASAMPSANGVLETSELRLQARSIG